MREKHQFGLFAATSYFEEINKAKTKWLNGFKKKHKDDITPQNDLRTFDDLKLFQKLIIGK